MSKSNYHKVGLCTSCQKDDDWTKRTTIYDTNGKSVKTTRMCTPCRLALKYLNQIRMSTHFVFVVTCGDDCHLDYIDQEIESEFEGYINTLGGGERYTTLWLHGGVDAENVTEVLWNIGYVKSVNTKIEVDEVLLKTAEKILGVTINNRQVGRSTTTETKERTTRFHPSPELKPDNVQLPKVTTRGDTLGND